MTHEVKLRELYCSGLPTYFRQISVNIPARCGKDATSAQPGSVRKTIRDSQFYHGSKFAAAISSNSL